MREILFRGKSLRDGEWVFGYYFVIFESKHFIRVPTNDGLQVLDIEVEPETVGQFTGLLDKNDNKIFEGDILKIDYIDELCYVIYNEENTLFEIHFKNDSETLGLNNYSHNIEVIGNIHDNGELYREIKENEK